MSSKPTRRSKSKSAPSRRGNPSAKATMAGPTHKRPASETDVLARKMAATETVAAAFPFNAAKAAEHDPKAALNPLIGDSMAPEEPTAGSSTVSEANTSPKVGNGPAPAGSNATIGSLDRV